MLNATFRRKWLIGSLVGGLSLLAIFTVQASSGAGAWVLSGGGGQASSANYAIGFTLGQGQPVGLSSSPSFSSSWGFWTGDVALEPLPGDLNGDGQVDLEDILIVMADFGASPPSDSRADANGDGRVGLLDLVTVAKFFGSVAGTP